MKFQAYRDCFKNIPNCAFATAVCQFVLFLIVFILLCFAYTLLSQLDSGLTDDLFVFEFQKYFTLTVAVLFLIPLALSLVLTYVIQYQHHKLLLWWIIASIVFSSILTIGLLGCGIFLSIKGSYVGYISLVIALVFDGFMVHSVLIMYFLYRSYTR